jgi:hypothetical protein
MALVLGTNCGFVESAPSADPATSDLLQDTRANAIADVSDSTATIVTEIGVWIDNATEAADIDLAIYTDNPGDNEPEAIVGSKATVAKGTSGGLWIKATGLSIPISGSTKYWIAAQLDNTATTTNTNTMSDAGEERAILTSVSALPDPWGTSAQLLAHKISVYAVWSAEAPAGNAGIMTPNAGYWGPTF